jgi:Flp pilus assembly protein TadG
MRRLLPKPSACRRFARCERGTQLVELAIVLPLLLVMFGAVAEFGRLFYTYQTLTKATRAGARYLTTEPANGASDAEAANLVVYGNTAGTGDPIIAGLTADNIEVTREGANPSLPERVSVSIDGFNYVPLFDLGALVGSDSLSMNVELEASTTMRMLAATPS